MAINVSKKPQSLPFIELTTCRPTVDDRADSHSANHIFHTIFRGAVDKRTAL